MVTPVEAMARAIPDRANRSLWWLVTVTMGALALPGPFWGSLITIQVTKKDYWPEALLGFVANAVGMLVSIWVLALLLRGRSSDRPSPRRDIGYVVIVSVIGALVRLFMVWLLQLGPQPMGRWALITQVSVVIPLLGATTVAIVYAASREREVTAGYREATAAHAALAREEEDVRGRIFDQLHGTLQAGLVDARRQLTLLADDPAQRDREALLALESRLGELYSADVAGLAGSLYPAGLEFGLCPALRQLAARFADTIDVRLDIDSFTQVLDDPALGGLHREVRFGAYRIVEECVVNAMRHSDAEHIDITVRSELRTASEARDAGTVLAITAVNHSAAASVIEPGHGLTRMRSRATGLGGRLSVTNADNRFLVQAWLPLQRGTEQD